MRWLGPWTPEARAPDVRTERLTIDGRFAAKIFSGDRAIGALAIAPGVHFLGPDDPRMDRFCRILAASGIVTLCPYLPDFVALRVRASAIDDFDLTFSTLRARFPRPGVFSISFGSLLALRLAAARPDDLAGLVVFGGYADWDATIRFAASGEIDGKPWIAHDGRNLPVVYMNLFDDLPPAVVAAWTRYVRASWGRAEMRDEPGWAPVARAHADGLSPADRDLYLRGCGLLPGALDEISRALDARRAALTYLDPRPHLSTIRRPVWLVHGLTDDVIPWPQAEELRRSLPAAAHARVLLTGLYGHTAIEGGRGPLAAAREVTTMTRIVSALVTAALGD
jgi:pimeloyl-ACP methyl ester carboxylesterase